MKMHAVFPMLLALIVALGILNVSKSPTREWTRTTYIVNQGDTLWNICRHHCPNGMDIWEYIYLVKKENNMASSTIHAGDTIILLKEVKTK